MSSRQRYSRETADSQFEAVQKQDRSSDLPRIVSESDMNISATKAPNDSGLSKRISSN